MKKLLLAVLMALPLACFGQDEPDMYRFGLSFTNLASATTNSTASTVMTLNRQYREAWFVFGHAASDPASTNASGLIIRIQPGFLSAGTNGVVTTNWVNTPQPWRLIMTPGGGTASYYASNVNLSGVRRLRVDQAINISGGGLTNVDLRVYGHKIE